MKEKIILSAFLAMSLASASAQTDDAKRAKEVEDSIARSLDMKEVVVVAQKPLVKMTTDKITYNVSMDTDAKASTVLDMLRKVPMVTVDGQDNITVNGSSAFKVYVNGKPNPMFSNNPAQIFKAMPATMVKDIEVVTNPGSKYDAEGTAGILNITMNSTIPGGGAGAASSAEALNGYNGNIRLSGGNKSLGASAFLNGQYGKFSFSANGSFMRMTISGSDVEMTQKNLLDGSTVDMLQSSDKAHTPMGMGNISMGYELDEASSLNASVGYQLFQIKNSGSVYNKMYGGMYGSGFDYTMYNDMNQKRNGLNLSLDYQRFLNKERTSQFSLIYLFSNSPSNSTNSSDYEVSSKESVPADYLVDRYSDSHDRSTENTFQTDFITDLKHDQKLNYGAKVSLLRGKAEADFFQGNGTMEYKPELSSEYLNNKNILAGYLEHEGKYGKFSTREGLRYEHTWQSIEYRKGNGENFDSSYGNLIPSASMSYSISAMSNLGLTYAMRISRPGISYLNPYVDRSSNTALTYGNPDLDVEKSHSVGLVYNMYTPKFMLNFNLNHTFTDDGIEQYSFYKDNLLNTTYGNIVSRNSTKASVFVNLMLHQNTRLFTNSALTYVDINSDQLGMKNHGWQWNTMVGLQQKLPYGINGSLFMIASSDTKTLQGTSASFQMVTANLSKSFLKNKLDVALQGMTGLSAGGKLNFKTESQSPTMYSSSNIKVPLAGVTLSVTYKFGNQQVKQRQHVSNVKSDFIEHRDGMEQIGSQMGSQQQ